MFAFLWAIIIGFVAGTIAKYLMPGRAPGGFIVTILLGIAGSVVATWIGRQIGWYEADQGARGLSGRWSARSSFWRSIASSCVTAAIGADRGRSDFRRSLRIQGVVGMSGFLGQILQGVMGGGQQGQASLSRAFCSRCWRLAMATIKASRRSFRNFRPRGLDTPSSLGWEPVRTLQFRPTRSGRCSRSSRSRAGRSKPARRRTQCAGCLPRHSRMSSTMLRPADGSGPAPGPEWAARPVVRWGWRLTVQARHEPVDIFRPDCKRPKNELLASLCGSRAAAQGV